MDILNEENSIFRTKRGTFLVNVCYCENGTWQGYVVWTDRNRKDYFRSALELMKLIDGALEQSTDEEQEPREIYSEKVISGIG